VPLPSTPVGTQPVSFFGRDGAPHPGHLGLLFWGPPAPFSDFGGIPPPSDWQCFGFSRFPPSFLPGARSCFNQPTTPPRGWWYHLPRPNPWLTGHSNLGQGLPPSFHVYVSHSLVPTPYPHHPLCAAPPLSAFPGYFPVFLCPQNPGFGNLFPHRFLGALAAPPICKGGGRDRPRPNTGSYMVMLPLGEGLL